METANRITGNLTRGVLGLILVAVVSSGCAGARTRSSSPDGKVGRESSARQTPDATAPESGGAAPSAASAYGPQPAPEGQESYYGPEKIQYRPVVLVLGPGRARGFAHVGVLRALHAAKIPIAAILGTEMGAFLGGLYALNGNLNHFEWSLQRFKEESFRPDDGLLAKLLDRDRAAKKFEEDLQRIMGRRDLATAKIPLKIGIELKDRQQPILVDRGSAVQAVRAAMAAPGIFPPGVWERVPALGAVQSRPFPVAEARALGLGSVIVVDVSESGELPAAASLELRDADLVVRPALKGIALDGFDKRTDAAFRGQDAIAQNMARIRQLVGLPESGESGP